MNNISIKKEDRVKLLKSRMKNTRLLILALIPVVLISNTHWPEDSVMHESMQWLGYFLILVGVMMRIYCSVFIGGRKNNAVINEGPYSIVRNPLYCASFVAVVGVGLQTASLIITGGLVLVFIIYYPFVVKREEAFLEQKFGEAYKQYKATTPRWIPNLTLWKSPAEINSRPYFVLRTILDTIPFIASIPAFELLHNAQEQGFLPTILHLI